MMMNSILQSIYASTALALAQASPATVQLASIIVEGSHVTATSNAFDTAFAKDRAGVCGKATFTELAQQPATTTVVRLAADWVDVINSADDAAYVRFVTERGPVLRDGPERWLELRSNLRGIQLCGVKSAQPDRVEVWAFEPSLDSYSLMQFKPGAKPADKIQFEGLWGTDAAPPGAILPAKLALPALITAVEARAAVRAANDEFSGAILLAKNGRILFQKAYGLADRAHRKPNRLDTQFRFGSMGKMFTAVAVMQLVEKGKLGLDAPIGRYLTGYSNKDIRTNVTLGNLLSHTGGTGDIFGPEFDAHKA
jgi:hypothetical protein